VKPEDDEQIWWVPLKIQTSKKHDSPAILTDREAVIPLPGYETTSISWEKLYEDPNFFYKLNSQQTGFYLVAYPSQLFSRIGHLLTQQFDGKHSIILTTADRVGLVHDVFSLAVSGGGSTVDALNMFSSFKNESEHM
jgi:aminopeptidase 2